MKRRSIESILQTFTDPVDINPGVYKFGDLVYVKTPKTSLIMNRHDAEQMLSMTTKEFRKSLKPKKK